MITLPVGSLVRVEIASLILSKVNLWVISFCTLNFFDEKRLKYLGMSISGLKLPPWVNIICLPSDPNILFGSSITSLFAAEN